MTNGGILQDALVASFDKGYRIVNGEALSPRGRVLAVCYQAAKYKIFSFRYLGRTRQIPFHRLVAYQKYGDAMLKKGVVIRHLNGDNQDNSEANIAIGTQKDNSGDIPTHMKRKAVHKASKTKRIHDHELVLSMCSSGMDYKQIASQLGIQRGSVHYIINRSLLKKDGHYLE